MPNFEDHYRKLAEANKSTKSMKDVVPNGEDIRTRNYGAHLRDERDRDCTGKIRPPAGNATAMFVGIAQQKVSCPECGAEPGQNCKSVAKTRDGEEMKTTVHGKRLAMAQRVFGKKCQ